MKAYKGFNKDMTCRGFQFEEGKTYEEETASLCNSGFHACENPLDCFGYYAPWQSVFREVELESVSDERQDDSKVCGKKITIGAELDVAGIVKAHFEYVTSRCEKVEGSVAGDKEAVSVKDNQSCSAGKFGSASAGYGGSASAGYRGSASAGNRGSAVSRGSVSVGENGAGLVRGNGVKIRGGLGALLVIAEENQYNYDIPNWKSFIVDGKKVKANVWYMLKDGELVEVEENA